MPACIPPNNLLSRAFDLELWQQAEKQAHRGALKKFNVGAVLFKDGKVIGRGCAHINSGLAIHAEQDAVMGLPRHMVQGSEVLVVSVNPKSGSWSYSSRPCARCSQYLHGRGILFVHYASRDENGIWSVRTESLEDLANNVDELIPLNRHIPSRIMKVADVEPYRVVLAA